MQVQVKKDNKYIKITSQIVVEFNIYKLENNSYVLKVNDIFDPNVIQVYDFEMDKSSIYKVVLIDAIETEVGTEPNITIEYSNYETFIGYFDSILADLSKDFVNFLCDKCNENISDCEPCGGQKNNLRFLRKFNTLTSKFNYYSSFIRKIYTKDEINNVDNFIYLGINTLSCKVNAQYDKLIAEECNKGLSNNTDLYKLLITINYLSLYFLEKFNNNNILENINSAYKIESVKNCLCNTSYRYEELEQIFEGGVIEPTVPVVTNRAPSGQDVFIDISSNTNIYEKALSKSLFSSSYSDDNTVNPVSILIESLPINGDLVDSTDTLVTVGQVIPFVDLESYKVIFNTTSPSTNFSNFTFKYSDGSLTSTTKKAIINLVTVENLPPTVSGEINERLLSSIKYFTKAELFSSTLVQDPEQDNISTLKLLNYNSTNILVSYKDNAGSYTPMNIGEERDFKNNFNNDDIIRIEHLAGRTDLGIIFDYKDDGSNKFGSSISSLNVLKINFSLKEEAEIVFTGGYIADPSQVPILVGVGRFTYTGSSSDLAAKLLVQFGSDFSENISIVPANNSFYDYYNNSGNIISGSGGNVNSLENHYDILMKTDFIKDQSFNFEISFNGERGHLYLGGNITLVKELPNIQIELITHTHPYETNIKALIDGLVEGVDKVTQTISIAEALEGKTFNINPAIINKDTCRFTFRISGVRVYETQIFNELNAGSVLLTSFYPMHYQADEVQYATSRNIFSGDSNLYYKFKFLL